MTRQQLRRKLVSDKFERFDGAHVPKDLAPRKERRKVARARGAGDWNRRAS